MKNKINFVSGETYTLAELFSGNRKIIIPDLQRDYCWGDNVQADGRKELVSGFVQTLMEQFDKKRQIEPLNLGLLYGYESPTNHIQLCDGQQRITTLYLLIGMLNRKIGTNEFRKYLISDYEYLKDDKEPYLQYSIRDTSLYFLSDLVCNFFIKSDDERNYVKDCGDITESLWYFSEYNLDPSIQSMIRAVNIINGILDNKTKEWCRDFGIFITTNLSFMYYDMENRKNGEETFVVINTTGEPLTNTQNLKPLVFIEEINKDYIRNDEYGESHSLPEDWEEIETWFWNKRSNNNETADAGFNEFLRWVTMLNSNNNELSRILSTGIYTFPKEKVSFAEIYSYWNTVKFLFDEWKYKDLLNQSYLSPSTNSDFKDTQCIGQIDCFLLLPMIAYCKKWKVNNPDDINTLRLYQFLHNLTRISNVGRNVNGLVKDVVLIATSFRDLIGLTDSEIASKISKTILSQEEILKLSIVKENPVKRSEIERAFWKAQSRAKEHCHYIWNGQILTLIEWASENGNFSLDKFNEYLSMFDKVFEGDAESNIDPVRRALLTRNLKEYPKIFRGYTNFSFGWEWSDWATLINENKDEFKSFLDDLIKGKTYDQMIEEFPQSQKWSEFVHKDYLMGYCEEKNIRWDDKEGWLLIQKQRITSYISVINLHLYNYLKQSLQEQGWEVWQWNGDRVVVENKVRDFVFDIWYFDSMWLIQFFRRKEDVEQSLSNYIDQSWHIKGNRYEKSTDYVGNENYAYPNIKNLLKEIIEKIEKTSF